MKARAFLMAFPLCGPLILARPAAPEFTGIIMVKKPNPYVLTVNIYATFTGDDGDFVYAVAGTPLNPLNVNVYNALGGSLYQHPFNGHGGGNLSPNPLLCDVFPSVCYDTFVTIGKKTSTGDVTGLAPGFPGFDTCGIEMNASGWFITPDDLQGRPDANNQVLLMQVSVEGGEGFAIIYGTLLVSGFSNGQDFSEALSFQFGDDFCPCSWNLNFDCEVGISDLLQLLSMWGSDSCYPVFTEGDVVGQAELAALLEHWGPCPSSDKCCP